MHFKKIVALFSALSLLGLLAACEKPASEKKDDGGAAKISAPAVEQKAPAAEQQQAPAVEQKAPAAEQQQAPAVEQKAPAAEQQQQQAPVADQQQQQQQAPTKKVEGC